MSTSAIITNRIVRTRSFPERPKRSVRTGSGRAADSSLISRASLLSVSQAAMPLRTRSSAKTTQPAYDAAHEGARQTPGEIGHRRAFSHLGIGRIWNNNPGKGVDIQFLVDGECPGGNVFGGSGANDRRPENVAPAIGDDLDVAIGRSGGQ